MEYGCDCRPKCGQESDVMICLASTSPRRKSLLKKAGLSFRVVALSYHEDKTIKASPIRLVCNHALGKAKSCVKKVKNGTILSADTFVYLHGKIFGKPKTKKDAVRMLGVLQGRRHFVYTGVAILKISDGKIKKRRIFTEKTQVWIKKLTLKGIRNYFKKVNPLDKAGAYAIQSCHGGIIQNVKGSFSNAVGLPI